MFIKPPGCSDSVIAAQPCWAYIYPLAIIYLPLVVKHMSPWQGQRGEPALPPQPHMCNIRLQSVVIFSNEVTLAVEKPLHMLLGSLKQARQTQIGTNIPVHFLLHLFRDFLCLDLTSRAVSLPCKSWGESSYRDNDGARNRIPGLDPSW